MKCTCPPCLSFLTSICEYLHSLGSALSSLPLFCIIFIWSTKYIIHRGIQGRRMVKYSPVSNPNLNFSLFLQITQALATSTAINGLSCTQRSGTLKKQTWLKTSSHNVPFLPVVAQCNPILMVFKSTDPFTSLGKFLDEKCQYGGQKEIGYSLLSRMRNYCKSNVGSLNHFCAMDPMAIWWKLWTSLRTMFQNI